MNGMTEMPPYGPTGSAAARNRALGLRPGMCDNRNVRQNSEFID
jgi:hypothetical protein